MVMVVISNHRRTAGATLYSPSIGTIFDAAHAGFAVWSSLLWEPIGAATVAEIRPGRGQRVLDACCGSGAAAVPAAAAVGPTGWVDGVDLAPKLLAAGRRRASEAGLSNIEFHTADVGAWQPVGRPYDHVVCIFGVFFLPDMDNGGARLLGLAKPGGRLAITTWQGGAVEPVITPFAEAAADEHRAAGSQPTAPIAARAAAARVDTEAGLAEFLGSVGTVDVEVRPFTLDIPLTPALAWDFAVGSATRAMLFGLESPAIDRVRERYLAVMAGLDTFQVTALIGHGRRG
jgi:SAM-dependent methyltransferase